MIFKYEMCVYKILHLFSHIIFLSHNCVCVLNVVVLSKVNTYNYHYHHIDNTSHKNTPIGIPHPNFKVLFTYKIEESKCQQNLTISLHNKNTKTQQNTSKLWCASKSKKLDSHHTPSLLILSTKKLESRSQWNWFQTYLPQITYDNQDKNL